MMDFDVVVIGAGAVGLACAAALAERGSSVLVIERADGIGTETSSRNSEVVHAGMYYPTDSLKHRLCVTGRRLLYPFMAQCNVAHRKCGKLIVATTEKELSQIEAIYRRGLENDVENLTLIDAKEATALEPHLNCVGALWSLETGIMDSHAFMLSLQGVLEANGGTVVFQTPVLQMEILPRGGFAVETGGHTPTRITCGALINSAGLMAQTIAAKLEGYDPALIPPLSLAKGSYFGCAGRPAFSRLIYPAPVDGGLGVHVTLDLQGRMRFGPDVEWLETNDPAAVDYSVDPARAQSFYSAIRRYWPGLPDGAIMPDYAGCRPKLSRQGEAAADFRIDGPHFHGHAGLVHLFGIESPGLTSSLAIAAHVAAMLH